MSSDPPAAVSKKIKPKSDQKSSKKRSRHEVHEESTPAEDDGRAKKQKKVKQEEDVRRTPTPPVVAEDAEQTPNTKKHSKPRKQRSEENVNDTAKANNNPVAASQTTDKTQHVDGIADDELVKRSPFVQKTLSLFLAMSPVAHNFPLEGVCAEHISPLLLTHYPPLRGILLSYSNPRLSEHPERGARAIINDGRAGGVLGKCIDEYAVTYLWLTADFLVFRPERDTVIEGYVSLQNESILGLLCYNYFNAAIETCRLPKHWQWTEEEDPDESHDSTRDGRRRAPGHYGDGQGNMVEGRIVIRVKDFEATAADGGTGGINIYGTLLSKEDDAKVDDELRLKFSVKHVSAKKTS